MSIDEVKRKIKEKGLKKSFVADKIGVSVVMFSYYLNKQRNLSEEKEQRLKTFLEG